MAGTGNPVEEGLIESLARPGGNITGLAQPVPHRALNLLTQRATMRAYCICVRDRSGPPRPGNRNCAGSRPLLPRYSSVRGRLRRSCVRVLLALLSEARERGAATGNPPRGERPTEMVSMPFEKETALAV